MGCNNPNLTQAMTDVQSVRSSSAISRWSSYIEISKRRSSSAEITATNFINAAAINDGSKILDLGCGHGRITELLVEKVPSIELVGVDMTRHLLENFVVRSGINKCKIELICADIAKLPIDDGCFDAVVSSRVFQYLPDPICGVREGVRVLKPGGRFVVSIPNRLNVVKYLTYRQKLYSPFEVRDWFRRCGLENIEYGSMCFFPSTTRWRRLASFLEGVAKIPFVKYLGGNVIVKGEKKMGTRVREAPANSRESSHPFRSARTGLQSLLRTS